MGTYAELTTRVELPQYLLVHADALLVHARGDTSVFFARPIFSDLGVRDAVGEVDFGIRCWCCAWSLGDGGDRRCCGLLLFADRKGF